MKRTILICFLVFVLSGCLPEYRVGCPEDLKLAFELEDKYEDGNYDTRIAADIILAVFNDRYFVTSIPITYDEIAGGKEYVIRKDETLVGNVEMVAWAASTVEGYDPSGIPGGQGNSIEDFSIGLDRMTRAGEDYYYPAQLGLYMGIAAINEKIDQASEHTIGMLHSSCRVEVHVTDGVGILGAGGEETAVTVHGSMSRMDMNFRGVGTQAVVYAGLDNTGADATRFSTGRFGIMPSSEGQTLSVEIMNDDEVVAVLTVPNTALPTGAQAGSLIIFEYVIGEAEFLVTINDFTHKVVIIDGV